MLLSQAEEEYRIFASKLIPGKDNLLGVRIPALRKFAKKLAKSDWKAYLMDARDDSFEETLLQGMVISYAEMEVQERLAHITRFLSKIDNWSTCDSFCIGLKFARTHPDTVWEFLQPYFQSKMPYESRFALVMCIYFFVEEKYLQVMFRHFDAIDHDDYYVQMAVAWAIATCYTSFRDTTMTYLKCNHLKDAVFNKALQKIIESNLTDREEKKAIDKMKRSKKTLHR